MNQERVNLCPYRQQFETDGFPVEPSPGNLNERYATDPRLEKIDLYTHLIPAVDQIVATMLKEQPKPPRFITEFDSLETQAATGLKRSISHYVREHDPNDLLPILATRKEGATGLPDLLSRGATTATRGMHKLLRRIPYAYREKYGSYTTSPDELVSIARTNYPFLRETAQQHLVDLEIQQSMGNISKADHFSTFMSYAKLDNDNSLYVDPSIHDKFPHLFDLNGRVITRKYQSPELWCPALYSKALYSLWSWHLSGAERIYAEQIRERRGPVVVFPQMPSLSAD